MKVYQPSLAAKSRARTYNSLGAAWICAGLVSNDTVVDPWAQPQPAGQPATGATVSHPIEQVLQAATGAQVLQVSQVLQVLQQPVLQVLQVLQPQLLQPRYATRLMMPRRAQQFEQLLQPAVAQVLQLTPQSLQPQVATGAAQQVEHVDAHVLHVLQQVGAQCDTVVQQVVRQGRAQQRRRNCASAESIDNASATIAITARPRFKRLIF